MPEAIKYSEQQKKDLEFFINRKRQLKDARSQSNIEKIWKQADADYLPHELGAIGKKVLVENERTEVSTSISLKINGEVELQVMIHISRYKQLSLSYLIVIQRQHSTQ